MTDATPDRSPQGIVTAQGKWVLVGLGAATKLQGMGAALCHGFSAAAALRWSARKLLMAGTFEITAAAVRGFHEVRRARIAAGCVTGLAGLLFILNPLLGLFPLLYIVIAWLFVRGVILLTAAYRS